MNIARRSILVIVSVLAVGTACAVGGGVSDRASGSVESAFASANKLYRAGKFKEAAAAYQKIVSEGFASGSLFYNLGNAYVKMGEIGKAVLFYERALRENPRDPEAKTNLEYTRGLLSDRVEESAIGILMQRISPAQWLSWRENVWGFVVFYWAGALLGVGGIWIRRRWKGALILSLCLLGVATLLGIVLFFRSPLWEHPAAIVLAKEVEVRYGPVLGESTAFTLHEGSKVRILRSAGGWDHILFSAGKVGWVPSETVRRI